VATLDRSKLVAPVVAQAAAFVIVLVIGGFTGHSSKPPAPTPTSSPSPSPSPSSQSASTSAGAGGHQAKLTVTVTQAGTNGVSAAGSTVEILQAATLATVRSGTLNAALEFTATLPAGTYQACVKPPADWTSSAKDTHVINGYICGPADLGSAAASVTLPLTPAPRVAQ